MVADLQSTVSGVRFRLFPKPPDLHPQRAPETVAVSGVPGLIGPGPSDERMYVIRSIGKHVPYGTSAAGPSDLGAHLPPWRGGTAPLVTPDAAGHFDHIPTHAHAFEQVHLFGSVRFTLDIWERLFGFPIRWHFAPVMSQLEINILPSLNNAHAGFGFLEIGAYHSPEAAPVPYALNFDVVAHEVGHLIIYSVVGVPSALQTGGEYFGFHESSADMTALIASMHFNSLVSPLLDETHGNLYTFNELNRFAEVSATDQIRMASNSVTMWDFAQGWSDEHALSQPLTGALFDAFVDIFQERLVERGVISRATADVTRVAAGRMQRAPAVQSAFDMAYARRSVDFHRALIEARDYVGKLLAQTWQHLSPDGLDYATVARIMLELDRVSTGGRYRRAIAESFAWRGIGTCHIGPRLSPPGPDSHSASVRTYVPPAYGRGGGTEFRGTARVRCGCRTRHSLRRVCHG